MRIEPEIRKSRTVLSTEELIDVEQGSMSYFGLDSFNAYRSYWKGALCDFSNAMPLGYCYHEYSSSPFSNANSIITEDEDRSKQAEQAAEKRPSLVPYDSEDE